MNGHTQKLLKHRLATALLAVLGSALATPVFADGSNASEAIHEIEAKDELELAINAESWSGVVETGVECPRIRLDSGQVYSLMGLGRDLSEPGTRIEITGTIALRSTCQQGRAIQVISSKRL